MLEPNGRRIRSQVAITLVALSLGVFTYLVRDDLMRIFGINLILPYSAMLFFFASAAASLLLLYLRGDISLAFLDRFVVANDPNDPSRELGAGNRKLIEDVSSLSERLSELRRDVTIATTTGTIDPEIIIERLRTDIIGRILAEVEQRYSAKVLETAHVTTMRSNLSDTSLRLRQEIAALTRRGNLNLVIGSVTTALAVGLLAYMVLGAEVKFTDVTSLLSHYIPRVTTVAFIEVFAFFFLKLYRSTLEEIKYYQNELTNNSVLAIGVEASIITDDQQARAKLFERLVLSDRNASTRSTPADVHKNMKSKDMAGILEQIVKIVAETAKQNS
jgi:hypothetical protein